MGRINMSHSLGIGEPRRMTIRHETINRAGLAVNVTG
jgi:hypothetical protein